MNATKERQAWCCLQVKLCDPCLSALYVPWCKKALYKYSSFPFLSFPFLSFPFLSKHRKRWISYSNSVCPSVRPSVSMRKIVIESGIRCSSTAWALTTIFPHSGTGYTEMAVFVSCRFQSIQSRFQAQWNTPLTRHWFTQRGGQ